MSSITFSPMQEKAINAIIEWYGEAARCASVEYVHGEVWSDIANRYVPQEIRIPKFDASRFKQEFYIAGYAGTGKSTIVAEAIRRLRERYKITYVPMGAYTGKAAYVLKKKGNAEASTIHGLIYNPQEVEKTDPITGHTILDERGEPVTELKFALNPIGMAAQADLLVLDECSMIDNEIANDLRSFGKPILVMGDPGQLPPINGEGSFTSRKPDFFLDEIHRQAADSPIIELATMARQGIMIPNGYRKGDVQVMPLTNGSAEEWLHKPDTQVLCGLNRIRWAVTQIMRHQQGFGGHLPLPGERLLCCKNNKQKGLFNGGMGTLREMKINAKGEWMITAFIEDKFYENLKSNSYLFKQHFDDGNVPRNPKDKYPNEFDWGYILSVHKAQGSSWPHVTLIDNSASFRENRWKHLYTAITRAETGLTVLTM